MLLHKIIKGNCLSQLPFKVKLTIMDNKNYPSSSHKNKLILITDIIDELFNFVLVFSLKTRK